VLLLLIKEFGIVDDATNGSVGITVEPPSFTMRTSFARICSFTRYWFFILSFFIQQYYDKRLQKYDFSRNKQNNSLIILQIRVLFPSLLKYFHTMDVVKGGSVGI